MKEIREKKRGYGFSDLLGRLFAIDINASQEWLGREWKIITNEPRGSGPPFASSVPAVVAERFCSFHTPS